jgi:tetratricopeptide (TPR) repeat protein
MMNLLRTVLFAAVLWLGVAASAQTVQLASGQTLLASVEDADGDGLRIRRLDNGGYLELRWDHLSAASALEIKRRFDLAGDSQDELLTTCEEVSYLVNGQPNRLIGKVVERTGTHLVVMQRGVPFRIPVGELRGMRQVQVPVTQIYTKEEYYAARLAEDPPGDSADKHLLLAEDLVKVRDYDHAEEHLKKAKELDNSRDKQRVDLMLSRLSRYKEAARERELLDQIQACRSRGQLVDFEKGEKLIEQFEKEFPQSKLKSDFDAETKRFGEVRVRYLTQQVAEQFRRSIQVLAEKKAADGSVSLQAARDYAENGMTEELFARTAQQLRIEVAEAKELWANRAKFPVGKRSEHFGYGLGSWVLGEQAVIKDTAVAKVQGQQAPAEGAGGDGNSRDVERIQRALRQAVERRRAAQQQGAAGGQQQREETDEDWWREAGRVERAGWLRAYYAEFGKQLVVTFASASQCVSCYGQGTVPEMGPDGKMIRGKCYLCHGTKWLRSFKAY